ncbi:hypothetical protein BHE74_00022301, partial [Ensete ventricosum]
MKPEQKFAISIFTAWYGRYIPVRQVAGTRTARYRAVPPKIDSRRSISAVDGRLREKSGRLREKKGRRRRGKEKKIREEENLAPVLARTPSLPSLAVRQRAVTRGSPAPVAARTRARRRNVSPRREKDRSD